MHLLYYNVGVGYGLGVDFIIASDLQWPVIREHSVWRVFVHYVVMLPFSPECQLNNVCLVMCPKHTPVYDDFACNSSVLALFFLVSLASVFVLRGISKFSGLVVFLVSLATV